jgi:hypothetical protein
MKYFTRLMMLLCIAFTVLAASACPKRVSIADIESNPGRYSNKDVAIAGRVTTSYGITVPFSKDGGGIYKISDGTGSIWVITRKSVPGKNAELGVKGKIQQGVTYAGKNYGLVLIEDDRKFKDN